MVATNKTIGQISCEAGQKVALRNMRKECQTLAAVPWEALETDFQKIHETCAAAVVDRCIELIKYEASFMDANAKLAANRFAFVLARLKTDGGEQ